MYIKVDQNDFTRKIIYFVTFTKMPKNVGDLGKLIATKGFEKLPKVWLDVASHMPNYNQLECFYSALHYYTNYGKKIWDRPWSSFVKEDEGLYLPNCQTHLVIALNAPYLLTWHFINTTAYPLDRYEPSSPVSWCALQIGSSIDHLHIKIIAVIAETIEIWPG